MAAVTLQEMKNALSEPDPATKDFLFQQTMFRVKDPKASLDFYSRVIGMRYLTRLDFEEMKFTIYIMGYEEASDIPEDDNERLLWAMSRKGVLELTHNWGTESDPEAKYHNGNTEPRGFGHIGLHVPDVQAACKRFEDLGVTFIKTPNSGKMKDIAFIQDPDGYWIEIFSTNTFDSVKQLRSIPS